MFCPNCGKKNPDDGKFCDSCGANLIEGAAAPAAAAAPAVPSAPAPASPVPAAAAAAAPFTPPPAFTPPKVQPAYAPPAQPAYAPPPAYYPPQAQAFPAADLNKPMSIGAFLGTYLLLMIPILNIVMVFIWAFGSSVNRNKKNLAWAILILVVIGIALGIAASFLFVGLWPSIVDYFSNMGY